MKYFYADGQNKTAGPASTEELRKLVTEGALQPDPMVVPESGGDWNRLSVFEGGSTTGASARPSGNGRPLAEPSAWSRGGAILFKMLGSPIDSYSDLLDDQAANATSVQKYFCERLARRGMPNVALQDGAITDGGFFSGTLLPETRNYYLTSTKSGALLAVRIAPFGNDLYISWHVFVCTLINWLVVIATFGLWLGGGLVAVIEYGRTKNVDTVALIFGFISMLGFALLLITILAGLMAARNPLHFFSKRPTFHDHEDIRAASTAVQNSLAESAELAGIRTPLRPKASFVGGIKPRGI